MSMILKKLFENFFNCRTCWSNTAADSHIGHADNVQIHSVAQSSWESFHCFPVFSISNTFCPFLHHHRLDGVGRDKPEIGGFDAMNELTSNVFVVSGKDLFILALLLLNICSVIVLVCRCTKNKVRTGKKVIYKPVSVSSENESLNV